MNSGQLVFNLGGRKMTGRDQLFRSSSNELALSILENYENWPQNKLILVGPKGCGKTHISSILSTEVKGYMCSAKDFDLDKILMVKNHTTVILEDFEKLADLDVINRKIVEEAIFHLIVKFDSSGSKILITGLESPSLWRIDLPDLSSRIKTFSLAKIESPDDKLFLNLILKFFSERQLHVSPGIINFIASRIDRTYRSASEFIEKVDARALKDKRELSLSLVKSVLDDIS